MNATEATPKNITNPRQDRICKISRVIKIMRLIAGCLYLLVGIWEAVDLKNHGNDSPSAFYWSQIIFYLCSALQYWFGYKLFSSYMGGRLFSATAVRWMKWIGVTAVLLGISSVSACILLMFQWPPHIRGGAFSMDNLARLGVLFSTLAHGILPGLVIICFAWIMDEGRKIQEEQELTV